MNRPNIKTLTGYVVHLCQDSESYQKNKEQTESKLFETSSTLAMAAFNWLALSAVHTNKMKKSF